MLPAIVVEADTIRTFKLLSHTIVHDYNTHRLLYLLPPLTLTVRYRHPINMDMQRMVEYRSCAGRLEMVLASCLAQTLFLCCVAIRSI